MAIVVMFEVEGATAERYDAVIRRLTANGEREPDGQLYHVCYGDRDSLQVIDIFESQAQLDAFGAKLVPILHEIGIEANASVFDVYNIPEGRQHAA